MFVSKKIKHENPTWKNETDFATQSDYVNYLEKLSHVVLKHMAKQNIPVAQRILAAYYYDEKKSKKHVLWMTKSAENGDPVSSLMLAEHHTKNHKFDIALSLVDKTIAETKKITDKEYYHHINGSIGSVLIHIGLAGMDDEAFEYAKKALEKAIPYNFIVSTQKLTLLHLQMENSVQALHYADLALFFSKNIPDSDSRDAYRAECHLLRGIAQFQGFKPETAYSDYLAAISDFQISITYKKNEQNVNHLERAIARVSVENRTNLLSDSKTLKLENGLVKTWAEFIKTFGYTSDEFAVWLEYPDPRNPSPQKSINPEEHFSLMFEKWGIFGKTEVNQAHSLAQSDNLKTEEHLNAPR